MMLQIGDFFLCLLFLVNILGLTLATGMWLRHAWLALIMGPLLICTVGFSIECYHGLGNISWLLPITTIVSFYLAWEVEQPTGTGYIDRLRFKLPLEAWRAALAPSRNATVYVVYALVFAYCISWRWIHPDIDNQTELIADLSYICSYMSGHTIPEMDYWFPPLSGSHYYTFQYYGAGLIGRLFQLEPGVAYNLSFGVLCSLAVTSTFAVVFALTNKIWIRVLVCAHMLWGGTGVTLFLYLFKKDPYPWDYMRFIGNPGLTGAQFSDLINHYNTGVYPPEVANQDLPAENMGYCIFLGDYHPVLSGFYLLGVSTLLAILWARLRLNSLMFLFGASVTWCVISNTWSLPITVFAMAGFLAYHTFTLLMEGSWKYYVLGAVIPVLMVLPFFREFTAGSEDIQHALQLVLWERHTPVLSFCLYFLPTLGLIVIGLISGTPRIRSLAFLMGFILMFTEFFYVHDEYSGPNERFNSALKWWPCVSHLTAMILAPLILDLSFDSVLFRSASSSGLDGRTGAVGADDFLLDLRSGNFIYIRKPVFALLALFLVAYPVEYIVDLGGEYIGRIQTADHLGRLGGSDYLTSTLTSWETQSLDSTAPTVSNLKLFLEQLSALPKSWVLAEQPEGESFCKAGAFTLFSNHPCFMGWVGHENLWRGSVAAIRYRFDTLTKVYAGTLPDAGKWLASQKVDVVLWFKTIDKDSNWDAVNKSLLSDYHWRDFIAEGDGHRIGYWERNVHEQN